MTPRQLLYSLLDAALAQGATSIVLGPYGDTLRRDLTEYVEANRTAANGLHLSVGVGAAAICDKRGAVLEIVAARASGEAA